MGSGGLPRKEPELTAINLKGRPSPGGFFAITITV